MVPVELMPMPAALDTVKVTPGLTASAMPLSIFQFSAAPIVWSEVRVHVLGDVLHTAPGIVSQET